MQWIIIEKIYKLECTECSERMHWIQYIERNIRLLDALMNSNDNLPNKNRSKK